MLTVNEFWIRVGIGAVLILLGVLLAIGGAGEIGAIAVVIGIGNIVWVAIKANRQVAKAKKVQRSR